MTQIDLHQLPPGVFEARRVVLLAGLDPVTSEGVRFLSERYARRDDVEECAAFAAYNLEEAAWGDVETLRRVGFFPWVEASQELDLALTQALLTFYKATYDHLRRAIELVVVGAFFVSSLSREQDAQAWVRSERETPLFSRALAKLLTLSPYRELHQSTDWATTLKKFYWTLSDVVHVRGIEASFGKLQPTKLRSGGVRAPHFDEACLSMALDTFIDCVRHCSTVLAAANPILLVGLPIDEKFGLNPPISGFYNETQAERLRRLLLPQGREFLDRWISSDPHVQSVHAWFRDRPDLTEAELERQAEEWRRLTEGAGA